MCREDRKALAYLRPSSKANVGADKDCDERQRAAIEVYTSTASYEVVESFYDAAGSGADFVGERIRFSGMLERLLSDGADD
jgi:DNA invertase Pin-like site-specific DNA recombinase